MYVSKTWIRTKSIGRKSKRKEILTLMTQEAIKLPVDEIHSKPSKRILPPIKLMFIIMMTFGLSIFWT